MISAALLLISSLAFSAMALEHKPQQTLIEANSTAAAGKFMRVGDVCLGDELGGADAATHLTTMDAQKMYFQCRAKCDRNTKCIGFNVAYNDEVGSAQKAVCYEYTHLYGSELYGDLYVNKRKLSDTHSGPSHEILGCHLQINQQCG